MAGGRLHSAVNSSGSAAAIAAGSSVPNRASTFSGPRNACSMPYCWSSIIPTSGAKACSSSTRSAVGSLAMWKPMPSSSPMTPLVEDASAAPLVEVARVSGLSRPP